MSKKWFGVLLIASIVGLIIAVSLKMGSVIIPFGDTNNPSSSSVSPTPSSTEEGSSKIKTSPAVQSEPSETIRPQEQPSTSQGPSEDPVPIIVNFSRYENSSYGVWIKYPSNWQIVHETDDNDGVIDITGFVSPFDVRFDKYKERLWISLDSLPSKRMTLEEYSNEVINQNNESLQDFELLDYDTDSTILAGYPAYRSVSTYLLDDGTNIKRMEIGTKIGSKVYFLDYYAEKEKYPNYLPVIYEMINSLEIKR